MQTVSVTRSVALIPDGASLMIGGSMAVGTPERAIDEIVRQGKMAHPTLTDAAGRPVTAELVVADQVAEMPL